MSDFDYNEEDLQLYARNHPIDFAYNYVGSQILQTGVKKEDRTGTGTLSIFGTYMDFDLSDGKIPLLTTKQVNHRSLIVETLWFLSGSTDVKYLKDNGVSIWDEWVIPETATYRPMNRAEKIRWIKNAYARKNVGQEFTQGNDLTDEALDALLAEYGILDRIPTAGSIGNGAYGANWRKWEDTRIIRRSELASFSARGYKQVGTLHHEYIADQIDNPRIAVTRTIDQIADAIKLLRSNPDSRRILVSAWNPTRNDEAALPACHFYHQIWTRQLSLTERLVLAQKAGNDTSAPARADVSGHTGLDLLNIPRRALTLGLGVRSNDWALGNPYNIAQYGILAHLYAQAAGMVAERLVYFGGDTHLYLDHIPQFSKQLLRQPKSNTARVVLNAAIKEIDDFKIEDIEVKDYHCQAPIHYPVAV